ncbi:MAG: patatin-like phospholipase family protein [Gammaproteobacteria bacterium]
MGKLIARHGLAWTLAGVWLCSFASQAEAQQLTGSSPPIRPRICLVLSGGGARGMAHIGVLKVLEDLKIPIDCIAGTSMGAIVGGLYASGMTAQQIDATIRSVDWQEAFHDAPPRRDLAFRRKQDDSNFLVRLPLGLKHGKILLPKGFIQGQKLQQTLRQLTLPFSNSTDFDQLPTPFCAVATDLETGSAVLLDKGDLAVAMRASMSAPGVFAPVESNGRLLVDGGLAENLPINVARAMHADILIVSDVSYPLQPRAALDSALSISNQMLAILVRKDSDRQRASLGPDDILIVPQLGLATSTDFAAANNVIVDGEEAARGSIAKLKTLSVGDGAYRDYLARRAAREPGLPRIQFVRVDEQSKRYEKTIMAEMQPLVGKPLDLNEVSKRITELYGLGNFETLDYSMVERPAAAPGAAAASAAAGTATGDEESGFEVRARRKSWGPNYLRFGLNLEDNFQGNSRYNAAARFILSEINELGAELLTDVQIGSDPQVVSEFYQPLSASRSWFVAPRVRIEARDLPIYVNNLEVADFRDREAEADLDFGRNLGNWGEIRAGFHRTNGATRVRFGDPGLVEQQYNKGEYFFRFSYDRLDDVHFPRAGQTFSLQWDANRTNLGADIASDRVRADWLMARSAGRNTILLWTSAGTTLDGKIPPTALPEFYSLGGFFNLSGLAPQSLIGPNYAISRAIYFRKIGHGGEGFFEFPAYLGMSFELGNTWDRRGDINFRSARKDASVFVAFDTFLGPVYLGSGYDQGGTAAFYLFLGRTF